MSTAESVLAILSQYELKQVSAKEWRCNSPFRPGSNSHAFAVTLEDGEHGAWHYFVSDEGGSLYDLAKRLGVDLPARVDATETKRGYDTLKDYDLTHHVPAGTFAAAGWIDGQVFNKRPAFQFIAGGMKRYRFKDGEKPPFQSQKGFKPCWYGLDKAIALANTLGFGSIVLCNGEPSTIVGLTYSVPAFCQSGGERGIHPELLKELNEKWHGDVLICLDCDETGRKAAAKIQSQIPARGVLIDLGGGKGFDLADFCGLHGLSSYNALLNLIEKDTVSIPEPDMISHSTVAIHAIDRITSYVPEGYPLVTPFQSMHQFGGFAQILTPGKVMLVIAPSAGGKTSFLETWADHWLQRGISGVMRGDEWKPEEYHNRRVQRYGGIGWNQIQFHEIYKIEQARNVPLQERKGIPLTAHEIEQYSEVSMWVSEWRGHLYHYNKQREKRSLEDSLLIMSDTVQERRRAGDLIGFAVLDYLQLLKSSQRPDDENSVEFVFGKIKTWAEDNNLVALVGSQATKQSSKDGQQRNKAISAHDAQYVRIDKSNLGITLNMEYIDDPAGRLNLDGSPLQVVTNNGILKVEKNNTGGKGTVKAYFDYERLQWLEVEVIPDALGKDK